MLDNKFKLLYTNIEKIEDIYAAGIISNNIKLTTFIYEDGQTILPLGDYDYMHSTNTIDGTLINISTADELKNYIYVCNKKELLDISDLMDKKLHPGAISLSPAGNRLLVVKTIKSLDGISMSILDLKGNLATNRSFYRVEPGNNYDLIVKETRVSKTKVLGYNLHIKIDDDYTDIETLDGCDSANLYRASVAEKRYVLLDYNGNLVIDNIFQSIDAYGEILCLTYTSSEVLYSVDYGKTILKPDQFFSNYKEFSSSLIGIYNDKSYLISKHNKSIIMEIDAIYLSMIKWEGRPTGKINE